MHAEPTRTQWQALDDLSRLPQWAEVKQLLTNELAKTTERLIEIAEGANVGRLQGRAKMLRDLLDLPERAADELVALRQAAAAALASRTP